VLGWLGAMVSVVAWVTLGRALAHEGGPAIVTSAALGAWTGFVGAFSAWIFQTENLVGITTPGLERVGAGFGFVGASLGLLYWPLIGAAICFGAAFFSLGRRLA
jgi:amino acid transporter